MIARQALGFEVIRVDEIQGCGIDAVAQTCWCRAILENMSQMTAIKGAVDLGAGHAMAVVDCGAHIPGCHRIPEAGPACARVVFVGRAEQRDLCSGKNVETGFLVIVVGVAKWGFGAVRTHYMILLWCQHLAPLRIAALYFEIALSLRSGRQ